METETPTSAPPGEAQEVIESLPVRNTEALFDSIAKERIDLRDTADNAVRLKSFFMTLLWIGYGIALVVGLMLIYSAVNSLLKIIPR